LGDKNGLFIAIIVLPTHSIQSQVRKKFWKFLLPKSCHPVEMLNGFTV